MSKTQRDENNDTIEWANNVLNETPIHLNSALDVWRMLRINIEKTLKLHNITPTKRQVLSVFASDVNVVQCNDMENQLYLLIERIDNSFKEQVN